MAYIYKITNQINGKIYIGKTIDSVEKRFEEHCKESRKERSTHRPLYAAMQKYGEKNFVVEMIEEVPANNLNEREIYWIEKFQSFKNGYNATIGGDGTSYLDYDLIFQTWLTNYSCNKTAELCHCCPDSVQKIVREYGEVPSRQKALSKPVAKINCQTNEIIQIYPSTLAAEKDNGNSHHIAQVCQGKRKTCQGFKWAYLSDLTLN